MYFCLKIENDKDADILLVFSLKLIYEVLVAYACAKSSDLKRFYKIKIPT